MKQYCKQGFIYLLFHLAAVCGKAVLHGCLPRLDTIYVFGSRGRSRVTRVATSDVICRQNFSPIRVTSETATAKKEDQRKDQKSVGGTAKKWWGAQVRDAQCEHHGWGGRITVRGRIRPDVRVRSEDTKTLTPPYGDDEVDYIEEEEDTREEGAGKEDTIAHDSDGIAERGQTPAPIVSVHLKTKY